MKIGLISDIHGNLEQLEAALALLHREAVDQIICAGDLVDFGTDGMGVVKRIVEQKIPCVSGNHDVATRSNQAFRRRQIEQGLKVELLDEPTFNAIVQLPRSLRFEWEGVSVFLAHSNPWFDDNTYIYPKSTPQLFRRVVSEAMADVVILGHTHQPMIIRSDGKTIINPGSVSVNFSMLFGTCGILSLPEQKFRLLNVETGEDVQINVA